MDDIGYLFEEPEGPPSKRNLGPFEYPLAQQSLCRNCVHCIVSSDKIIGRCLKGIQLGEIPAVSDENGVFQACAMKEVVSIID